MQISCKSFHTLTNKREHELVLNIFPKTQMCWQAPAHLALPNILQTQFTWYDCRFPKHCVFFFFQSSNWREAAGHQRRSKARNPGDEGYVPCHVIWGKSALLSYCSRNQIICLVVFCSSPFSLHYYFHHAWFCQHSWQPCGGWGGGQSLISKQENDLYPIRQRKKHCSKAATFSTEQQVAIFTLMQENRCIL